MNRRDPRIRRTLDDLNTTFETFSTQTQAAAFSFTQQYINPCLASLSTCLDASCAPCVAFRRDRLRARRQRHQSRASNRPELVFDFYNDVWEEEEDGANEHTGLLSGWGADELDRILAGRGSAEQPRGERRAMNYGARGTAGNAGRVRGKSVGKGEQDPRVLPGSSMFGFLERLPWKLGGRGVRYRPSAADLQEGLGRKDRTEGDLLLDDSEDADSWGEGAAGGVRRGGHRRQRSGTVKSTSTTNSLSSRGDLFPSDEEDDAVPLDDEFAMALERRNTEDAPSSGGRSTKSKLARSMSGFTTASKSTRSSRRKTRASDGEQDAGTTGSDMRTPASEVKMSLDDERKPIPETPEPDEGLPTMDELRAEDEQVRMNEEAEVERKREEATKVAIERGLMSEEPPGETQARDGADKGQTGQSRAQGESLPQSPPATTKDGGPALSQD